MHTILLVGKALVVFLPNLLELCEVFDLEVRRQSDNMICQFFFDRGSIAEPPISGEELATKGFQRWLKFFKLRSGSMDFQPQQLRRAIQDCLQRRIHIL